MSLVLNTFVAFTQQTTETITITIVWRREKIVNFFHTRLDFDRLMRCLPQSMLWKSTETTQQQHVRGTLVGKFCVFLHVLRKQFKVARLLMYNDIVTIENNHRSNCDYAIGNELRRHYAKPYFLPSDSELIRTDWMFMGTPNHGAHMHVSADCFWERERENNTPCW